MMRVEVLDATHTKLSELLDVDQLTLVGRATRGGSFVLDAPASRAAHILARTDGSEIRVRDHGRVVFAGLVDHWEENSDSDGHRFSFTGIDHLARLAWRNTDPDPTTAPPYTAAYSTYTGTPPEVVASMVADRCATTALPSRQFLSVAVPSPSGQTINVSLRHRTKLSEVVDSLCIAYGLTVSVNVESGGLVFRVVEAPDRLGVPVGPGRALRGYSASGSAPLATVATVGGQGELLARTFVEQEHPPSARWPWRIETYAEHTEIDNTPDLTDAADELLAESVEQIGFTADVETFNSATVRYGEHFFLGDRIPVRLHGVTSLARVTEVVTTMTDVVNHRLTVGVPTAKGITMALARTQQTDLRARRQRGT